MKQMISAQQEYGSFHSTTLDLCIPLPQCDLLLAPPLNPPIGLGLLTPSRVMEKRAVPRMQIQSPMPVPNAVSSYTYTATRGNKKHHVVGHPASGCVWGEHVTFSFATLWENGQVPSACLHVPRRNLHMNNADAERKSKWEELLVLGVFLFSSNSLLLQMGTKHCAIAAEFVFKLIPRISETDQTFSPRHHWAQHNTSHQRRKYTRAKCKTPTKKYNFAPDITRRGDKNSPRISSNTYNNLIAFCFCSALCVSYL